MIRRWPSERVRWRAGALIMVAVCWYLCGAGLAGTLGAASGIPQHPFSASLVATADAAFTAGMAWCAGLNWRSFKRLGPAR